MKSVVVEFKGQKLTLLCNEDGIISSEFEANCPAAVKAGLTLEYLKSLPVIRPGNKGGVVKIGDVEVELSKGVCGVAGKNYRSASGVNNTELQNQLQWLFEQAKLPKGTLAEVHAHFDQFIKRDKDAEIAALKRELAEARAALASGKN